MSLIRRIPWTEQPQYAATVDWGHPTARGLEFAWIPAAGGFELANGRAATFAGPSGRVAIGAGRFGLVGRGGSNLSTRWDGRAFRASTEYTALTVVLDDSGRGVTRSPFDADNPVGYRLFQLRLDSGNTPRAIVFSSGGNAQATGATAVSSTDPTALAVRLQGTTASVWVNGVQQGSATISGTANTLGNTDSRLSVGSQSDNVTYTQGYSGQVGVCFYWGRALSDAEIAQMSANPWQLFAPHRIFVPQAAAAPTFQAAWARNRNTIITGPLR